MILKLAYIIAALLSFNEQKAQGPAYLDKFLLSDTSRSLVYTQGFPLIIDTIWRDLKNRQLKFYPKTVMFTALASTRSVASIPFIVTSDANGWISPAPASALQFTSLGGSSVFAATKQDKISGNGFVKSTGTVVSYDNSTYYLASNPDGYINSVPAQSFGSITGRPTTLSGYGITDGYPLMGNPSNFLTSQIPQTLSGSGTSTISLSGGGGNFVIPAPAVNNATIASTNMTVSTSGNSFTLTAPTNTLMSLSASTGISVTGNTITNSAPDQVISISAVGGNTISGTYPNFTITRKRQETYTGSTNASGLVTFTFSAFSAIPNVQYCGGFGSGNKETIIPNAAYTTTSVVLYCQLRADVLGILPSYSNVSGREINILVTEK